MSELASSFAVPSEDGYPIEAFAWKPAGTLKGIVQIAHGMGEHASRYRRLAAALNAAGYGVYANEHRGHGSLAQARSQLGDFGPRGFKGLSDDMAAVTRLARSEHPGAPVFLLGHSMGSFAAQVYAVDHSELIAGLALSGTAAVDLLLSGRSADWKLEDANAAVANPRTNFDWLSRDASEVDLYVADPLCGFTVNPQGMGSLGAECTRATTPAALARIRRDLPLFGFTGSQDPVNNYLEWFEPLLARYRSAGLRNVSSHVYGGARHEVFNELNREEVTANFIAWLEGVSTA